MSNPSGLVSLSLKKGPYVFGTPKMAPVEPVAQVAAPAPAPAQFEATIPLPEIPILKELLTRVYERILVRADVVAIRPAEDYAAQYKKLLNTLQLITDGGRKKIVEIALALYLGKRSPKTKGGVSDTFIQNYSIDISVPGDGPAAAGAGAAGVGNRQINEALYAYYNALPNDSKIPTLIVRKVKNFYLIGINDRQGEDIIPSYHISIPLAPEEVGPFPTYNMHFTIEQVAPLRNEHEFHHFNDPRGPIKRVGGPGPGPLVRQVPAAKQVIVGPVAVATAVQLAKGPVGPGFRHARTRVAGNNVGVAQRQATGINKWVSRAKRGGKRRSTRKKARKSRQ